MQIDELFCSGKILKCTLCKLKLVCIEYTAKELIWIVLAEDDRPYNSTCNLFIMRRDGQKRKKSKAFNQIAADF